MLHGSESATLTLTFVAVQQDRRRWPDKMVLDNMVSQQLVYGHFV